MTSDMTCDSDEVIHASVVTICIDHGSQVDLQDLMVSLYLISGGLYREGQDRGLRCADRTVAWIGSLRLFCLLLLDPLQHLLDPRAVSSSVPFRKQFTQHT